MRELTPLTGLRGVAALIVLVGHYWYLVENYLGLSVTFLKPWMQNPGTGVDLFFVLSGFVIFYNYFDKIRDSAERGRRRYFYWKRFARINPVYFLTTCTAAVFYVSASATGHVFVNESASNLSVESFVANILCLQELVSLPSLNGPAWSVGAEEKLSS